MNEVTRNAFLDELIKIAQADVPPEPQTPVQPGPQTAPVHKEHPAMTVAKGVGGFALGAGLGYVGSHLTEKGLKALGADGVPLPVLRYGPAVVGGAAGLGFGLLQHRMMNRIANNVHQEVPNGELAEDSRR